METPSLAFSHFGIFVFDLEVMAVFYRRVLGLVQTGRGFLPGREVLFLSGDPKEHHQIVLATGRSAAIDAQLINQISFRVASLEELKDVFARLKDDPQASDFHPMDHGNAWTLYFRNPEGNRLEIFADSPWYVNQPIGEALDLTLPADEIRRRTEERCRNDASFVPVEEWRRSLEDQVAELRAR